MKFLDLLWGSLALLVSSTPALADDAREFCADRPGLGTPSCTLAPGGQMVELGLAGWEHQADRAGSEDDVTLGDLLLRFGIDDRTELQAGWTIAGIHREKDRTSGTVDHATRVGDVTLALRRGLAGLNGPVAVQAFVSLPVGRRPVGAGNWGAGVLLPVSIKLPQEFELDLTPEIDAAVDADGDGRHFAGGAVIGLSHALTDAITLSGEVAAFRDNDPSGHATDSRVTASLAWQPADDWQVDVEADAGLNHNTPDHALFVGIARRFR